jgi:adenosylcobinamide kinase/adenosylcobinamide-phosphate guanylyltransferase
MSWFSGFSKMHPDSHLTLILGGARSGKSARAEALAAASRGPVAYVATYCVGAEDVEMRARVEQHRLRRPAHWRTLENQFDLAAVFSNTGGDLVLVDCLTLWLSYQQMQGLAEPEILSRLEHALGVAREKGVRVIFVSNELGMGLVPSAAESRGFRDLAGRANQLVARHADTVEFVIAGLPLTLKGGV